MTDPKKVVARFQLEAMSNLRPNDTGVKGAVIWVSAGEFAGADAQHGPRIKVVLGEKITTDGLKEALSVRLTEPPEVLGELPGKLKKQAIAFVNANREVLLRYWSFEIGTPEMVRLLQRI
jgi:hypothetical protein